MYSALKSLWSPVRKAELKTDPATSVICRCGRIVMGVWPSCSGDSSCMLTDPSWARSLRPQPSRLQVSCSLGLRPWRVQLYWRLRVLDWEALSPSDPSEFGAFSGGILSPSRKTDWAVLNPWKAWRCSHMLLEQCSPARNRLIITTSDVRLYHLGVEDVAGAFRGSFVDWTLARQALQTL